MEVHLTPDQEILIQHWVRAGRFATADEAMQAAVTLLEERECLTKKVRISERKTLAQLFADSPFRGLNLEFPRDKDPLRLIEL